MIESIDYGTQTIEFEVQRRKACKNTYITVERDIGVVVKTNVDISIEELKTLVKSKAKWILKKFEEIGQSIDYGRIVTGSRLFYMGKSYYIELLKEDRIDYKIEFIHSKFIIKTPPNAEQKNLNEIIEEFYKQKAQEKITDTRTDSTFLAPLPADQDFADYCWTDCLDSGWVPLLSG